MTGFVKIILEASFTAGLAALAVILLRLAMKKAPKRWAYALWAVVFFRCLCPFSVESGLSLFNAVNAVPERTAQERIEEFSEVAESYGTENILPVQTDLNTYGYQTAAPALTDVPPVYAPPPVVTENVPEKKPVDKYAVMFAVWAFGAAAMALYGAVSYVLLMRKLRTAVKTEEGVFESDRISTAFSAGFFPPKIYVPCGLFEEERKLIVAHERVHIKRLDYIVKPIAFLALTLHWFNPLIWLSFALMTRDMELSCDEAVLKIFGAGEKKAYSEALLRVSMRRSGLADGSFLPLAFAETGIKGRVKNVLKYKKPTLIVTVFAAAAVVAACVVLGTNAKSGTDSTDEDIRYILLQNELNNTFVDGDGEQIFILRDYTVYPEFPEMQNCFIEGEMTGDSAEFTVDVESANDIIMNVDVTELKINSLDINKKNGKNFLKAQFEFKTAEDFVMQGDAVDIRDKEKAEYLMVEGGGNDGVYTLSAEYELNGGGEYGYAFMLRGFKDVPIYVNSDLLKDEENVNAATDEGAVTYKQLSKGTTNLSLNGYVPAYIACDLEESGSTGVIGYSDTVDGGQAMFTGFHDDYSFQFHNAYTNEIDTLRVANYGENDYVHILGMTTKLGANTFASTLLDMEEYGVKSITLEDMYTENEGDTLYLNIDLKFTSDAMDVMEISSNQVSDAPGTYSLAVHKLADEGEYVLSVKVRYLYGADSLDSFAVILSGFEDAEKYVNPKLMLDRMELYPAEEYPYDNEKIEKVYTNKDLVKISLYSGGLFRVMDFTSSFMQGISEKEYRFENGSLILEFMDGSVLCFDETYGGTQADGEASYAFNKAASHKADARSRKVPFFKDGEVFAFDKEWLELGKTAKREKAYRSAIDYGELEVAYKRDNRTIYLFKNGDFDLYDSSRENDPNEGIDGSYKIDGETLTLKYKGGSKLCFDMVSSGYEELDPALVKEFELCKYKLVYDSKKSRISKKQTEDIPPIYHGELFDFDGNFIAMKLQSGDVSEEFFNSRERITDEEYYHKYVEPQIQAEEELRRLEEEERKRAEEEIKLVEKETEMRKRAEEAEVRRRMFESCDAAVKFIENPSTKFAKAYFNGVNVLLLQEDGTFMIDCITRNYAPSEPPEKDYTYDEDGALLLNFKDGSLLRFVPNDDNLSFDLDGSHSNTPMDVLLYDDGAVFINYENAEEYMQLLKDAGSMIYLQYPVDAVISDHFGGDRGHKGIDFEVQKGTEVYAAASGEVTEVGTGWNGGYGNSVTVKCSKYDMFGMENIYAHMNEVLVKEGDKVNAGDLIGYSGSTGDTAYETLHFEVKIDGQYVDPEEYLQ